MKYIDDCTLWEVDSSSSLDSSLQAAASEVMQWTVTNKMALIYDKTGAMRLLPENTTTHPVANATRHHNNG